MIGYDKTSDQAKRIPGCIISTPEEPREKSAGIKASKVALDRARVIGWWRAGLGLHLSRKEPRTANSGLFRDLVSFLLIFLP